MIGQCGPYDAHPPDTKTAGAQFRVGYRMSRIAERPEGYVPWVAATRELGRKSSQWFST